MLTRLNALLDLATDDYTPEPARDPKRIPQILEEVQAFWLANPEFRLGQLVEIMAMMSGRQDAFYLEDDIFLATLRDQRAR